VLPSSSEALLNVPLFWRSTLPSTDPGFVGLEASVTVQVVAVAETQTGAAVSRSPQPAPCVWIVA
jgi:hypothetical protein